MLWPSRSGRPNPRRTTSVLSPLPPENRFSGTPHTDESERRRAGLAIVVPAPGVWPLIRKLPFATRSRISGASEASGDTRALPPPQHKRLAAILRCMVDLFPEPHKVVDRRD